MATNYPNAIDAFVNPLPDDDMDVVLHDQQHASANDAIEAIETELGTTPSGSADTVRERFEDIEGDVAGLTITLTTHVNPPGLNPDPHGDRAYTDDIVADHTGDTSGAHAASAVIYDDTDNLYINVGDVQGALDRAEAEMQNRIDEITNEASTRANDDTYILGLITDLDIRSMSFSVDGQGSVLTTGEKNRPGHVRIPVGITLTGWSIDSDVSCSAVIDILRATSAEWEAGTAGTSIVGAGNKPTLSTDTSADASIVSWTDALLDVGDRVWIEIESNDTATTLIIHLYGVVT